MLKGYKIVYTASDYTMNEKTLEKNYFNSQKTEIVIFLPAESYASSALDDMAKKEMRKWATFLKIVNAQNSLKNLTDKV